MTDVIYRVTYADGSMCHTGHWPLAKVWAKWPGAKLEEIELKSPTRLRIVNSGDSMADCYERAFTGANRTAATWLAFRAGWNAAKPSDQAIYNNIAARYFRDTTEPAPLTDEDLEAMWEADTTSAEDCASLYFFKVVARAVERAHGIGGSLVGLSKGDGFVTGTSDVD